MALTIDESLLKTAEDLDPKDRSDRETTPGRLLDLFVLVLTIDAYRMAGSEDEHLNKGLALYRMHRSSIEAAAAKHIETLMDRPDAGTIKSKYRLIEQLDPSRKARFVEDLMVWLRHRSALMRDVFPKRVYTNAVKVAAACEEEDVAIRVQKLAIVPTSSGLSTMFRWVKQTAEVLGSPPDTVDVVAAEAEGARGIATELKEVTQKLAAEPKTSPIRADLEDKQLDLRADLSEAIGDSEDPQTTMSAATTRLSSESKVAQKFGLTPEQEDVMHSMGKLVIAAGAGSGKTMTIVATIADLVEERGYQPNQIMTCSFTRAASSQLESRVENAGIHGARIGTTHSIAREIIKRHRPDLEQAVNSVKNADKLFKMALKQVPLSVELYQESLEKNTGAMKRIEAIPGWQDLDILRSFHTQLSRGKTLSPKQEAVITKFEGGGGGGGGGRGKPYYKRYAEEDKPLVEAVRAAMSPPSAPPVTAAYSEPFGEQISKYWTTPVGQWFNLGIPIVDALGKPMGEKRAKLYVENFKNAGQSVDDVRSELGEGNALAALYGAYEWLKQNDPVLAPAMDYTDQLVTALNLLKDSPEARDAEQRRYKVVLVDESQDLNQIQYDMFSILGEKADLYACIGDDKQCCHVDTPIAVIGGEVRAEDLKPGDQVLSNRNGRIVPQTVKNVVLSTWKEGFKLTTDGGHSLTISPNHKIWASEPMTDGLDQVAVYLMYRSDMGFRVGITNKGKNNKRGGDYLNSYGGRAFMERAERMWILNILSNREEALLQEERYSLQYGIPTIVFNGTNRGINQDRIGKLFTEFGKNGSKLLKERSLSFDLPHWMSQSYTKHGRTRRTIHLIAHSSSNTQVALEWSEDDLDLVLEGHFKKVGDRRRIRRWFANYREGLNYAQELARLSEANLRESLSTPEGRLHLFTASGLFPGMQLVVLDTPETGIVLETITTVESVHGNFVDLDVDDASNFFGGSILSHNSIYAFRGAKPSNFVTETKKEGVQTKLLTMNFRSGKAIVEAANKLIAHNEDRQIPMVCDADAGRKGMGAIRAKDALTHEDAADQVAQEIKDACDAGDSPKDFGILVRNNAEADAYTLSLLVRGVPYRMLKKSEGGYFGKPLVKALTAWVRLAIGGNKDEVNEAVLDAHMTPGFGLDRQFSTGLSRNTRGESYLDHIMSGKPVYTGAAYWMNKKVAEYAAVIRNIRAQGGADSPSLIRAILNVKGSKGTFEDALLKLVDEEDIIEDEGLEAGEEALRNAAMAPLRPLMVMAENFKDPEVLLGFIAKMKAANEKAQKKDPTDKDDWKEPAVLVGTVHGWKGLEAKHVYVCMAGGVFPNFKTDEKAAEDPTAYDEERRLAYVAITRGEQSVTIMAPQTNYNGKPAGTSRFIDEACIQMVGKPSDHPEMDPNTSQLTVSDPSQEETDLKTAKVGSFKDALALYASPVASFDHDDYPEFDLPEIEIHAANTIEELATQLHNDLTGVKDAHDLSVEAAENNIILLANTIQEKRACDGACGNTECKCEGTCTCGGNCSKEPEYNYDFS